MLCQEFWNHLQVLSRENKAKLLFFFREGRVSGILEVSRSFGDGRFKHCGVICTPDIMRCSLTDKDKFILLACDGLWKGFQVEEAMQYINDKIRMVSRSPIYIIVIYILKLLIVCSLLCNSLSRILIHQ